MSINSTTMRRHSTQNLSHIKLGKTIKRKGASHLDAAKASIDEALNPKLDKISASVKAGDAIVSLRKFVNANS